MRALTLHLSGGGGIEGGGLIFNGKFRGRGIIYVFRGGTKTLSVSQVNFSTPLVINYEYSLVFAIDCILFIN